MVKLELDLHNIFARVSIIGMVLAFFAQAIVALSGAAQAEVTTPLKPIKPTYRIIKGTPEEPEEKQPEVKRPAKPDNSDAARTWAVISETNDITILDRFIAQFPGTQQALQALNRRDQLLQGSAVTDANQNTAPSSRDRPNSPVQFEERPEFSRIIQTELLRMGCEPGQPDGKWGRKSIEAAKRFSRYSGAEVPTEYPNIALLASVQAGEDATCPVECGVKFNNIGGQCVAKTCERGQRLSSKGQCYTPKTAKTCRRGERLSSRGVCFKPKSKKIQVATPRKVEKPSKVATPRKVKKPANNRCSWCTTKIGVEIYACGARVARLRASGDCN